MSSISQPLRDLRISGLSLALTAVVCILSQPSALFSHYGLSYYGNVPVTLPAFCLGLVVTAYFLRRAAWRLRQFPAASVQRMRGGLEVMALSLVGIVLTPSLSTLWIIQEIHLLFGVLIFAGSAHLSLRYIVWIRGRMVDWLLLGCQLLAILLAGLSLELVGVLQFMLPAQLACAAAFSLLLLRAVSFQPAS